MTPLQLSRNKILVIPVERSHRPERIQPNVENSAPHCALARTAPPGLPTANMSDSVPEPRHFREDARYLPLIDRKQRFGGFWQRIQEILPVLGRHLIELYNFHRLRRT